MERSNRIVIVSHCVLNQNAVVQPLARAAGPMRCAAILAQSGCGIYQMPCPEKRMCGMGRPGMNADQYGSIRGFRALCEELTEMLIWDLRDYIRYGYTIVGMIAIQGSPTCSVSGERGVLMQCICARLAEEGIDIPILEIPKAGEDEAFLRSVHTLLAER